MEEQVERLVKNTWDRYKAIPKSKRYLVGVSGIPGSGKTTLASLVARRLNDIYHEGSPGAGHGNQRAAFVPMDGYHLTRQQLDGLPNPANAHARRGAAFTFDGDKFLQLVKKLREPICPESCTVHAPSFDHALKDPVEDDIPITPSMRIILFEGNYLALNKSPWKDAAELMDELWFVEVDFDVSRTRLVARHVKSGIAANEDEANKRVTENDHVNGHEIVDNRLDVNEVITSKEDEEWKFE